MQAFGGENSSFFLKEVKLTGNKACSIFIIEENSDNRDTWRDETED
jgi:predicted nucleic-acid-binding Zn-ribbon protein